MVTAFVSVVVPFTPVGALFQFAPLPVTVLGPLLAVLVGYALVTEVVKRRFYRWHDRSTVR